jgi:hypothetical protein
MPATTSKHLVICSCGLWRRRQHRAWLSAAVRRLAPVLPRTICRNTAACAYKYGAIHALAPRAV